MSFNQLCKVVCVAAFAFVMFGGIRSVAAIEIKTVEYPKTEEANEDEVNESGYMLGSNGDTGDGGTGGGGGTYDGPLQKCADGKTFGYPVQGWSGALGYDFNEACGSCSAWGRHPGIDFAIVSGTPIYAINDGTVVLSADIPQGAGNGSCGGYSSFGRHIIISHCDVNGVEVRSHYAHLTQRLVSAGESVTKGQLIGYSGATGNTGSSCGAHLHFAMFSGGCSNEYSSASCGLNPYAYLQ